MRDLPVADRPVVLVWGKRLWRCPEPVCPTGTWLDESDEIAPWAVLTVWARAEICRRGWARRARSLRQHGTSGCHAMRQCPRCVITVVPGSTTSSGWAHPLPLGSMRYRFWPPRPIIPPCS
jgi:hypothetical protein